MRDDTPSVLSTGPGPSGPAKIGIYVKALIEHGVVEGPRLALRRRLAATLVEHVRTGRDALP